MKLREILQDLDVLYKNVDLETEITGICYDSRAAKAGFLFVAVRGFAVDGHRFIPAAIKNGAAVVLCETPPESSTPYVQIKDCRLGLALASRAFFGYPSRRMKMIGFTGTNGKTTSSYLMKHLLETKCRAKVGLIGTNGIMIGDTFLHSDRTTPESYELQRLFREMADAGCTHVVMEVSSHSLSLERVAGIHFDVAVFTNLTQDHLDFHGSMEAYAAAKQKLFRMCEIGCFNEDDPWAGFMEQGASCQLYRFSAGAKTAELSASEIQLESDSVRFNVCEEGNKVSTKLGIPGFFSVHNALGVIAAGRALGVSLSDCADAMTDAKGVKGRVEVVPTDGDYSVLIDYAHTPDALENVLKTLKPLTRGRLIALFGCGGDRDRGKRPIMGRIAAENADFCIVTSDNPRTEKPEDILNDILEGMKESPTPCIVICDRVEAIGWAIDNAGSGDVILLAGKGHEDYQEVGHEKHHMDEREIVANCLKNRNHT